MCVGMIPVTGISTIASGRYSRTDACMVEDTIMYKAVPDHVLAYPITAGVNNIASHLHAHT